VGIQRHNELPRSAIGKIEKRDPRALLWMAQAQ
jgi:hypothetical protein